MVSRIPSKQRSHEMAFQLVGFDKDLQQEGMSGELTDLEFKFSLLVAVYSRLPRSLYLNFPQFFVREAGLC
ncbi:hypothetical protein C7B80_05405 [Cyanosarcina cf. burmensis CCALA 770]|jgi:hypothetical protein|nr:hypothetical protein C7B80_05405 [Cyanosarcina cf. burmensis CCALA 770]